MSDVKIIHRVSVGADAETIRKDVQDYAGELFHIIVANGDLGLYGEGEDAIVTSSDGEEFSATIVEVDPSESRICVGIPYTD